MFLRMDQVRVRHSPPQSHNPSPDHSTDGAGGPGNKWFDKAGDVCLIMYLTWSLLSHAKYMSGSHSPQSAWRCCVKLRWEPENMAMKKKKVGMCGAVTQVGCWMFGINQELVEGKMSVLWVHAHELSLCYHAQARKLLHVHACVHTYSIFSQSIFLFLMQ